MKLLFVFSLFCGMSCAQISAQPSPQAPPPLVPPGAAAPVKPQVPPDTVVAEVDGKKYTAADVDNLLDIFKLSPQMEQNARANPQRALSYLLMMKHLAEEAQKAKLDQQSPLKEQLEYGRLNTLAQAELTHMRDEIVVSRDDERKEYNEHPDRYQEAKVKVIYIAFSPSQAAAKETDGKKLRTEAEAKAKIEELRMKVAAGGDFSQLAMENSDDKSSASKGGDFPLITRSSSYPENIKKAVFDLKPGQVSEPIRQPNGFYLIRLEEIKTQPYDEVRSKIYDELKLQRANDQVQQLQQRFEVKVDNAAYFTPQRPPIPAPVVPAPNQTH